MTKKMEDFFNLPPVQETYESPFTTTEERMVDTCEVFSSLSTAEKIDHALPTVIGINEHDNDMDSIALKAMTTFADLISLGGNVPDMHAGKIYEVAGQMLKTALDAKNAKADRKLKMIDLQLKRMRTEQVSPETAVGGHPGGGEFDRNELLKYIVSSKSENSDK